MIPQLRAIKMMPLLLCKSLVTERLTYENLKIFASEGDGVNQRMLECYRDTNGACHTLELDLVSMWGPLWTPKGDPVDTVKPTLVDCGIVAAECELGSKLST